jgi:hypothetical protein
MEHDLSRAQWRKSSYSDNTGNCVEVANLDYIIGVRDSKDPNRKTLFIACGKWYDFVDAVKVGFNS